MVVKGNFALAGKQLALLQDRLSCKAAATPDHFACLHINGVQAVIAAGASRDEQDIVTKELISFFATSTLAPFAYRMYETAASFCN